ncbi:YbbM seven transmembrane helix protein [Acidisarcina polymorpha]|uniref:YbbM seven transmembrane helix protein n=1 Tax=Acidisarcina polymorpha TaxID=2211140 RepID=A0A2Z5G5W0_9BACT|nr:ABC transporter permease [Acidisarcina polymorpha]AXC14481.1 YbbM seven transmembrane helix protein [Acidisarcina polymorpha]
MLERFFPSQLARGIAECAIAALLSFIVLLLVRRRGVSLLAELPLAQLRGIAQILAVGAVLEWMLHGPQWTSLLVLMGMMLAAASIVRRRAKSIPRAFTLALISIFSGAGSVLLIMTLVGVIPLRVAMIVPVGSMVIAQTMNMQSIFLDRLRGEVTSHIGEIESALALGASPDVALSRYLQAAYRASLIPSLDNVKSLGIVWIPGIMAGMVLSGSSPVYAALYQFVVLTTIFSAAALTCLVCSYLVTRRVFTINEQLLLR